MSNKEYKVVLTFVGGVLNDEVVANGLVGKLVRRKGSDVVETVARVSVDRKCVDLRTSTGARIVCSYYDTFKEFEVVEGVVSKDDTKLESLGEQRCKLVCELSKLDAQIAAEETKEKSIQLLAKRIKDVCKLVNLTIDVTNAATILYNEMERQKNIKKNNKR